MWQSDDGKFKRILLFQMVGRMQYNDLERILWL
jgi:hypothetical protein